MTPEPTPEPSEMYALPVGISLGAIVLCVLLLVNYHHRRRGGGGGGGGGDGGGGGGGGGGGCGGGGGGGWFQCTREEPWRLAAVLRNELPWEEPERDCGYHAADLAEGGPMSRQLLMHVRALFTTGGAADHPVAGYDFHTKGSTIGEY